MTEQNHSPVGLAVPDEAAEGVAAPHGRYVQPVPTNRLPPEVVTIDSDRVSCDGLDAGLGHPRVWLTVDKYTGFVDCTYCDRRFVMSPDAKPAH
jgi:uncharacterized Zn-finger protein